MTNSDSVSFSSAFLPPMKGFNMKMLNLSSRERMNKEDTTSDLDHVIDFRKVPEADMPVPDRSRSKRDSKRLVKQLKLSQRIGLLLYMNRVEVKEISTGGKERLLYLQERAPLGALLAGLEFCSRLLDDKTLSPHFIHEMNELNRRPQSRRFRLREKTRIGVGYRDKGTLHRETDLGRSEAHDQNWIYLRNLSSDLIEMIYYVYPSSMEGEWLDWEELDQSMKIDGLELPDRLLLNLL
jgi:hypothetical protein